MSVRAALPGILAGLTAPREVANNIHIPWSAPLSRAGLLPVLPAVCAAGDIAEAVEAI